MRRGALLLPLAALLGGCTIGSRYAGPPAAAAPRATSGAAFVRAQGYAAGPPAARWWTAMGDATLDRLEARALAAHPDIAVAPARLRQARAALRGERGNRFPDLKGSALYAHARVPGLNLQREGGGASSAFNIYNLGFNASWEVDLFGGEARAIEAADATVGAARANLADAQVSLTAEVARAYVGIRDHQRRLTLAREAIDAQEQAVALTRERFGRGTGSRLDVERAGTALEEARAAELALDAEQTALLDALAVLTGDEPGSAEALVGAPAPIPLPPAAVAIGDPAALLRRRPDIRAAERTLAADTAKVGQAQAARFPRLSFMGIVGIGGSRPGDLSHLDDFTALLAPQLSFSFLDFGRTAARVEQARGVRDEAEARYRSAVLTALRDAEDSLARFRASRALVASRARTRDSAAATVTLTRQRYGAGTTRLDDLLDAERRQLSAAQDLSSAEAGLSTDFIALQKALGLGWEEAAASDDQTRTK